MVKIRVAMTLDDETLDALNRQAKADGFSGIAPVVRRFVMQGVRKTQSDDEDRKTLDVPVKNYRELAGFVEAKKMWSVEAFAVFAMGQYMSKYPIKQAQKQEDGKSIG